MTEQCPVNRTVRYRCHVPGEPSVDWPAVASRADGVLSPDGSCTFDAVAGHIIVTVPVNGDGQGHGHDRADSAVVIALVAGGLDPTIAVNLVVEAPTEAINGGPPLTPRERQVLDEVVSGRRNKEVASALGIGEETVKSHLTAIMRKFGVGNRSELIAAAYRRDLVGNEDWLPVDRRRRRVGDSNPRRP